MKNNSENFTEVPFIRVLGEIVAVWTLANIGYYLVLPMFGLQLSYNSFPVAIALYFFIWAVASIFIFWKVYKRWFGFDSHVWLSGVLSLGSALVLLVLVYLFSLLPVISGPSLSAYTDILFATPWYFLPKSIEILVQQLLITVLVLELFFRFQTLKNVVIGYALCFGGAHIVLYILNGAPAPYSIAMTLGAFLSSLMFPYLILKVRGGFVYSYMIHFVFYILLASLLHVLPLPGYVI